MDNKKIAIAHHPKGAFVYAVWHQNLIAGIFAHIGEKYTMIVSESKDGELVAVTCEKFGHVPARGSSTRGGKKALLEMVKNVKSGIPGAITVDGPKGPPHVVKPGALEIARLAECAILPMSPFSERFWCIEKSWDKFRIPKPFSRIVIALGKPIYVSPTIEREQFDALALEVARAIEAGEEVAKSYFTKA